MLINGGGCMLGWLSNEKERDSLNNYGFSLLSTWLLSSRAPDTNCAPLRLLQEWRHQKIQTELMYEECTRPQVSFLQKEALWGPISNPHLKSPFSNTDLISTFFKIVVLFMVPLFHPLLNFAPNRFGQKYCCNIPHPRVRSGLGLLHNGITSHNSILNNALNNALNT